MKLLALIIIASFAFSSCEKNKDQDNQTTNKLEGPYGGSFYRTGMTDTAIISIRFNNNTYEGNSDRDKYPAICHGSFMQDGSSITFTDVCAWTADFDWTLILNGTYNISRISDTQFRIWRTSGSVTDEYVLRKVTR